VRGFAHRDPQRGQDTHALALRNIRIQGESSPQPDGRQESCTERNTRSGCGMTMVKRPSGVVRPVMPPGDPPGAPFWCQTCAEWGAAAFEEAWATHYGSVTLWADNAESPTTCLSSGTCYDSTGAPFFGTDLEASSYPHEENNCDANTANPEARWPLSAMRYFWDVYDNHNDADGDTYSASQGNFWQHFANLAWYPEGTDTNQIDEPWNSTYTAVTEPDGRGSTSYFVNYDANVTYTGTLWADNCAPP
jgi:hypothetical protein